MSRTILIQDWVTIRSALSSVTQTEEEWANVSGFGDAAFWVDIAEVTPPGGSTNHISLVFETAPSNDESLFVPATGAAFLGSAAPFRTPSTTPLVVTSVKSVSTVSLGNYVRWRIIASAAGNWDLTFRVRAVLMRQRAFVPTDLASCALWLRSDLGITLDAASSNGVSGWSDQSGNGRNASQSGTAEPTYAATAINGLPALEGNGSTQYMSTTSFTVASSTTQLTVVQPTASPQSNYARIIESDNAGAYYLGATFNGNAYKFIAADGVSPFGFAETGSIQLTGGSIVSATYASGNGTIYYNGASAISSTFAGGGTPGGSWPLYLMRKDSLAQSFWSGYLAEVIIYDRALASAELLRVHRYLGTRYGIVVP